MGVTPKNIYAEITLIYKKPIYSSQTCSLSFQLETVFGGQLYLKSHHYFGLLEIELLRQLVKQSNTNYSF